MKQFAQLVLDLERGREPERAWTEYLDSAAKADVVRAIALVTGQDARRHLSSVDLVQKTKDFVRLPDWLFEQSFSESGDTAEACAMLVSTIEPEDFAGRFNEQEQAWLLGHQHSVLDIPSLSQWFDGLSLAFASDEPNAVELWIKKRWISSDENTRVVFNRILLGSCRCRTSEAPMLRALAAKYKIPAAAIAHRMSTWSSTRWQQPDASEFAELFQPCLSDRDWDAIDLHSILPFTSDVRETISTSIEFTERWCAEWMWDGIRVQLVRRADHVQWHATGLETLAGKFPEASDSALLLPPGTSLEGVLIAGDEQSPLPSERLHSRLNRLHPSPRYLLQNPISLMVTDLLQLAGDDLTSLSWLERRKRLEQLFSDLELHPSALILSPVFRETWPELELRHQQSRRIGINGLVLKGLHEPYGSSGGPRLHWTSSPLTFLGVLLHVRKTGDIGAMYEATFAVATNGGLVTLARTPLGFDQETERREFEAFVKRTTVEKFGPLRTLQPDRVYEIQISAAARSTRHRSGIAVRDPQIVNWRTDRQLSDVSQLDQLREAWGLADA